MIVQEDIDYKLIRTYSDSGYEIRQIETGLIYSEAVDIKPIRFTYEETDNKIIKEDEDNTPSVEI